jgi:WD40 repeat protein
MGDDGRARVRDLVRGREIAAVDLGVNPNIGSAFGPQASVAIDPGGRRLAAASVDGAVRLWDMGALDSPNLLRGHLGPVASLSFAADGRQMLSAGADGSVRVWPVAGGSPTILSQPATGARAAFSRDGRFVVSTDLAGTARVWDWRAEKVLATLPAHRGIAFDADFTPDGRSVVTAGNDGRLRVWDWRRGLVLVALRQEGFAFGVDALPDGRRFVSASDDGSVRVWECDVCGPVEEVLALAKKRTTRDLTADERERFRVPGR